MMPDAKAKLLIVEDEALLRTSLSLIFTSLGHSVRSAEDGFAALAELRSEIPDILLSDLNMPGMSGFELLSIVRRRFSAIQVIAMSAAFSGDKVPLGVAADSFYEKGSNPGALLDKVQAMAQMVRSSIRDLNTTAPIWIPKNGRDQTGSEYVMVSCPECLRAFPQIVEGDIQSIHEAGCAHCSTSFRYAIVQPMHKPCLQAPKQNAAARVVASHGFPRLAASE
ncbi:MAG: response regulator [Acidobacteria bacterium]|nr:response regulator [Acidobacteriota bacterium]